MKIIPALPAAPLTQTVIDMIRARAPMHPTRDAVICGTTRRSWRDFSTRTNQAAQALMALGVKKGSRVAMLSPNSVAMAELFIATLKAGAIAVPLSSMASPEALAGMLTDCEAEVFFLASSYAELGAQAVARAPRVFDPEGQEWQSLCEKQPDLDPNVAVEMEDGFNIIYSSGTTGVPKGILHSHAMRAAQMDRITPNGYDAEARTLLSTPLCSNTTLVSFLPTLAGGSTAILMAKFDAKTWLELAEREAVTHTMLVPVLFRRLLDHPAFAETDLSHLQRKFCTSAPLRDSVKREVLARMPGKLMEVYGLTEGGGVCILVADEYPEKLHTVGRPAPGVEIRILNENGDPVPTGEPGEIIGRGPAMMAGYWRRPEQTRDSLWYAPDGTVFFRSGDIGRFDEDGFLILSDRKKDVIITGGFNVYADDIERILLSLPDVVDAAVIGVPSEEWGETPLAFVVLHSNAGTRRAEEIRQLANARLGKAQRLAEVRLRNDLPRSEIGKILKRELRSEA